MGNFRLMKDKHVRISHAFPGMNQSHKTSNPIDTIQRAGPCGAWWLHRDCDPYTVWWPGFCTKPPKFHDFLSWYPLPRQQLDTKMERLRERLKTMSQQAGNSRCWRSMIYLTFWNFWACSWIFKYNSHFILYQRDCKEYSPTQMLWLGIASLYDSHPPGVSIGSPFSCGDGGTNASNKVPWSEDIIQYIETVFILNLKMTFALVSSVGVEHWATKS